MTGTERRPRSQEPGGASALVRAGLADIARAQRVLAEPAVAALVASAPEEVVGDFSVAADPDLALLVLSRILQAEDCPDDLAREWADDADSRRRLLRILGLSAGLGEILVRRPSAWFAVTGHELPPTRSQVRAQLVAAVGADPDDAAPVASVVGEEAYVALRRAYRNILLSIADSDVNGGASIAQVTAELSDLADGVLEAALAIARAEVPDHPAARLGVVAMGKCGARELNYLSDVDVIFVVEPADGYEEADAIRAGTQLAQRMMNVTVAGTIEGAIWEIDAGLRPEGKSGALVRTLASHADYYARWAKTWEYQALLKARAAAGDLQVAGQFVEDTRPGVWSASRRPDFVTDVQAMRRKVEANIPSKQAGRALKLGPGGIRDIEFSVQMLQMVHGASDITVRAPATLDALEQLATWGYVGREDAQQLARAYAFQRTLEHRLQLRNLRRVHVLPADADDLRWLGRSLGLDSDPAEELLRRWRDVARDVRRLHEKLFYRPLLDAVARLEPGEARLTPEAARDRLTMLGYADPVGALRHIEALSSGVSRRAAIQRTLLPVMLGWFADGPDPDAGLLGFRQVSDALGATPWYLRLLRDESAVAERLATILSTSRYASELVTRAPEAVRILADSDALAAPLNPAVGAEMRTVALRHTTALSSGAAVRSLRRRDLFRIAAGDLVAGVGPDVVAESLTVVTDATIEAVLASATATAAQQRGGALPTEVLVVSMGRLGGRDMSYASDADVMFVHDPVPGADEREATDVAHGIVQAVREALSVPSPDPPLEMDADLRPEGRQGPLVRTLASYETYYRRFSAPWETQALLRARPLGDSQLSRRFLAVIDPVRYPVGGISDSDVVHIRRLKARMESERLPRGADPRRHTKLGPGGLSDVEWAVQLIQLRYGGQDPALRTTATAAALEAAVAGGYLRPKDEAALRRAWELATRMRNAITLVRGVPSDMVPVGVPESVAVSRVMGYRPGQTGDLLEDYLRVTRRARAVFDRVFYAEDGE